jgi:predicted  nucleic acid-binding Zn-ribbon protein
MSDVTNELMYELLKRMNSRLDRIDDSVRDMTRELQAMREHILAINKDVSNVYSRLVSHDLRLERIERRLDLHDDVVVQG